MNKILFPALALLAAASAAPASASDVSVSFSPVVGGYTFAVKDKLDTNVAAGGRLGLSFLDHGVDGINLEGVFTFVPTRSSRNGASTEAYLFRAEALYPLFDFHGFAPNVAAGGGGIVFNGGGKPDGKSPLVDYGFGARYYLTDNLALRVDARHLCIFDTSTRSNFEYTGGLNFYFGGDRKKTSAPVAAVFSESETVPVQQPVVTAPAPMVEPEPVREPVPAPKPVLPPPPAPPVVSVPASPPVVPFRQPLVSSVRHVRDGIVITLTEPISSYDAFLLSSPARLVIDLPGVANGTNITSVQVKQFGVSTVRIGSDTGKTRIVLDSPRKSFPAYGISRDLRSIRIQFTGK